MSNQDRHGPLEYASHPDGALMNIVTGQSVHSDINADNSVNVNADNSVRQWKTSRVGGQILSVALSVS